MKLSDIKEFPIISFPIEWIYVYKIILTVVANEHYCSCTCEKINIGLNAYHSFMIAAAAYNVGKVEEANKLISDIEESLINYKGIIKYPFIYTIGDDTYKFYKNGEVEKVNSKPDDSKPIIPEPDDGEDNPPTETEYRNQYYIGSIETSSAVFNELTLTTLLGHAIKNTIISKTAEVNTEDLNVNISNKVLFMLIPSTGEITKLNFISNGFVSDVLNDLKLHSDTIVIDDKEYSCYWYRNAGANVNNSIKYTYRLRFINNSK